MQTSFENAQLFELLKAILKKYINITIIINFEGNV